MTYIKINETIYPATINGKLMDSEWGNRDSKSITIEMDYATAMKTFVDDLAWSIIHEGEPFTHPLTGETVTPETVEYDNADYCVAGPITDNRDGTVTVKMGRPTDAELLAVIMGGN